MSMHPSSWELIARAHRVTASFNLRTRHAVAAIPGNPGRVSVERFGSTWATRCDLPDAPGWMNLLGPLSPADVQLVPDMLTWYGELRPWIEVTPQPEQESLARELIRHGAVPAHFLDLLRGPTAAPVVGAADIDVARVTAEDALLFAHTLLSGHVDSYPDHEADGLVTLVGGDELHCYLARIDGEPAAAAALLIAGDGLAYLANASCLSRFRNRGCHTALLAARLRDAATAGCDSAIALAAVGSTSHRNMERAGISTLVTLTQWTFPG